MLGRLFGKSKDTTDEPVCYQCGRTLLAGEWTQKIEGPEGEERLLCSLCRQPSPESGGERLKIGGRGGARVVGDGTRVVGDGAQADDGGARVVDDDAAPVAVQPAPRDENEALWKAIKDRDAQIEALTERLAQSEAERQELVGRLARLQAAEAAPADDGAAEDAAPDEGAPGEAASDEAAEMVTTTDEAGPTAGEPAEVGVTPPDDVAADRDAVLESETTLETRATDEAAAETAEAPGPDHAGEESGIAEVEAQAASMTLLQRGVDLLNISPVPRKIAETNTDLGIPSVHVGFEGQTAMATFLWSMGWYRFAVDIESGEVTLDERGYDDRGDLQPNARVRADGTVQLAAVRISRAATQRQHEDRAAPAADEPAEAAPAGVEAAPEPAAGRPEITSKSLLGQRTDDERPSWEQTQARDFDWNR